MSVDVHIISVSVSLSQTYTSISVLSPKTHSSIYVLFFKAVILSVVSLDIEFYPSAVSLDM